MLLIFQGYILTAITLARSSRNSATTQERKNWIVWLNVKIFYYFFSASVGLEKNSQGKT